MKYVDGKRLADNLVAKYAEEIKAMQLHSPPTIVICTSGEDPASQIYIQNKQKMLEKAGIVVRVFQIPLDWNQKDLVHCLQAYNAVKHISGVLVQLPLPERFDTDVIINTVAPEKDLDGFTYENLGKLFSGKPNLIPCTPKGIIYALREYNVAIAKSNVVIVGRSNIVGKPLASLFTNLDATVTLCHSKTKNLAEVTKQADILVAAVGKPNFITADMIKKGAVVVDVGINRLENKKIVGDVDVQGLEQVASLVTPVPGGVGPLTVAMLLSNVVQILKTQKVTN